MPNALLRLTLVLSLFLSGVFFFASEKNRAQEREGSDSILLKMVLDESLPAYTRARSLRYLRPDHPQLTLERLTDFLNSQDKDLAIESVRTLRERSESQAAELLRAIAGDEKRPASLRVEAVAGLSAGDDKAKELLHRLAKDANADVSEEARRKLRKPDQILQWDGEKLLEELNGGSAPTGSPERGSRIFFTSDQKCARCHTYDGRGASVGPDLTRIAETRTPAKIAESILHPSREIAPQFTVYQLQLTSGVVKTGVYVGATQEGKQRFVDAQAIAFELDPQEIEARHALQTSLMPNDLTKQMTKEEFLDLLAFLSQK